MKTISIIFLCFVLISLSFGVGYYINLQISTPSIENTTQNVIENTVINNIPQFEFVSQTEYTQGDGNGSTIVKLIDWKGDNINTTCWEQILYPNKDIFINWTLMIQQWEYGNYYLIFVLPTPLGEYDQEVRCAMLNKNLSIGKGFHVSNITTEMEARINELKQDDMVVITT